MLAVRIYGDALIGEAVGLDERRRREMYHDFCRREREAQDVRDGGVDVRWRFRAEERAHDEARLAAGLRVRPRRGER